MNVPVQSKDVEDDRWEEQEAPTLIHVDEDSVHILNLTIESRDVASYLVGISEKDRPEAVTSMLELGCRMIESVNSTQQMEFVRRQVEGVLGKVEGIPDIVVGALRDKVGDGKGQVLEPIARMVEMSSRHLKELVAKVDPASDASTLGRALKEIRERVDPRRTDSIQTTLANAVTAVCGVDGALAATFKQAMIDALQPLDKAVADLTKQVLAQQAGDLALDQTTKKGAPYEEEVTARLQLWARGMGLEVHRVGDDNQPGDILVISSQHALPAVDMTIVVEARNQETAVGHRRIAADLAKKMGVRGAQAAIYVTKTAAGLAKEIDGFAEGTCQAGPYIATTHDLLIFAVRWLLMTYRAQMARASLPITDVEAIEQQIQRVRTALRTITTINTKAGAAKTAVDGIQSLADTLRTEIQEAMAEIEASLRAAPGTAAA
jgi:hypothetical protein